MALKALGMIETRGLVAAIEAAKARVGSEGLFLDSSVIPNPDKSLWASIL